MNEETYRIKPLEWSPCPLISNSAWKAETLSGNIWISRVGSEFEVDAYGDPLIKRHESLEDAKAAAEAYYRSRLLSALEPVPCKETT